MLTGFLSRVWLFFANLFATDGFPARWYCGSVWTEEPEVGWLHIISDLAIFGAYLAIPITLVFFLMRRRDFPFPKLVVLFALFIVSCGFVHLTEAIIFWEPVYRFSGFMKLITAIVSLGTVFAMIPVIPRVLNLPDLEKLNAQMEVEIAERKKAERELLRHMKQLEKSNQELDEFAYIASHDLRSPLQAVKNLASWIRDDNEGQLNEESVRYIELMQQRIKRMETLLDDLLQYSRVGRKNQEPEEVDTNHLLKSITDSLQRPASMKIEIGPGMPVFHTIKVPLDLTLRNLIQNAIKHHDREDGYIRVTCQNVGTYYEFAVQDDGPGISPEFHERIFKMFETLRPRDDVEGSGMGLSIVKKTVEAIDGKVSLESEIGQGTTFRILWPKILAKEGQE
ncbi:hypothetical protein DTL21_22595 [Bremerella cremea]|uniref:histidine kinase n=1 Tax=Blastopirellula marina TaxID=124 RepID=A0A2S8FFP6_9BACT|nr:MULTISPECIES: ATP-binding protein [Pirellulaceae]PQO30983.1 hypothetical protein C5Y83_22560 [Blastopirellula marina]RCS44130.1 hypothetical protein DTL21_22595 [Bremerella cremea]